MTNGDSRLECGPVGSLSGVKVLDMSRVLSGPFATMTLGDLGADVIKVERPDGGDDTRQWGPPFQRDQSSYFLSVNRNKRSVVVDLKSVDGHRIVRTLADRADIIVENFRPGTMAKLHLDYDEVSHTNPGVIYTSISGFGQTGPDARRAGYDAIAQARSGLMSVTGDPGGQPVRVGISSTDLTAGMWALVGTLAALYRKQQTGRGQWVDISLLDGQISWLTYVAAGYFASHKVPGRYGSAHPTIAPYQAFQTSDGALMVAVGNDRLWRSFAEALGVAHLSEAPEFARNQDRVKNREKLVSILSSVLRTKRSGEWIAILDRAGVPVGPVNTIDQVFHDPQVLARGMIWTTEHPTAGSVMVAACPLKLSESQVSLRRAPPTLGQHTGEVLRELEANTLWAGDRPDPKLRQDSAPTRPTM